MFWKFSYPTSQITSILEKPDVTLEEILNEDDVLQECKSNNEKLVTFLTQIDNIKQLVSNIVTLPKEEDTNESTRFKYSNISCELLTCDIALINETLITNEELIDMLYSFLNNESPLNPLLASYFSKVIGSLISRRTEQLLQYLETKTNFVDLIIKHINTSAIMDILLRLLTTIDNNDLKKRVFKWLDDIKLIDNLINLFSSTYNEDIHANVAQLLCDIIRITREQIFSNREALRESAAYSNNSNNSNSGDYLFQSTMPNTFDYNGKSNQNVTNEFLLTNPLLDSIEKLENIEKLLGYMFNQENPSKSSLQYGIDVLLALLEPKTSTIEFIIDYKNQEADRLLKEQERLLIASNGINNTCEACVSKLNLIDSILESKPIIEQAKMTFGTLNPPLGVVRLNTIKLIAKLILTNNSKIIEEIIKLGTLNKILNLAFEFKWNNFLHAQMINILNHIFTSKKEEENFENDLQMKFIDHLFTDCCLMDKILNAWFSYFESALYDKTNGKKSNNSGYIGHLTNICNLITKCSQEGRFVDYFKSYFQEINKEIGNQWKEIEDTKLKEINRKYSQDLVRNPLSSSTDSNTESDNVEFPSEIDMNKKFVEFNKDMQPCFTDSFGISESNLTSLGTKSNDGFSKLQTISFQSFQMDTNDENAQLFDQICSQRDSMRDAIGGGNGTSDGDEDVWVQREIKFADTTDVQMESSKNDYDSKKDFFKNSSSSSSESSSSSDSEDEIVDKTIQNELFMNNQEIKSNEQQIEEMDYTNSNDEIIESQNDSNSNWADFSAFKPEPIKEQEQTNSIEENQIMDTKNEGENWANFDGFKELSNERCSSPNDCPNLLMDSSLANDRSKTYLKEIQTQEATIVNKETQQETIGNESS